MSSQPAVLGARLTSDWRLWRFVGSGGRRVLQPESCQRRGFERAAEDQHGGLLEQERPGHERVLGSLQLADLVSQRGEGSAGHGRISRPALQGSREELHEQRKLRVHGPSQHFGRSIGRECSGGHRPPEGLNDLGHRRVGRGEEQLLLGAVVPVERSLGDPGGPADLVHVHVRVAAARERSEEHTSELQSRENLVCRLLLDKKNKNRINTLFSKTKQKKISNKTNK